MFKVEQYPHGTFSWAELASTDVDKSKAFYSELMAWETVDIPMGNGATYTIFKKGDANITAMSPMQPEMIAAGVPSHWNNFVTIDNLDGMAGKVRELGGTVLAEPFPVFDRGTLMVIQDPDGATLNLWQAQNHIGADLVNTPGAMSWNELATHDTGKVVPFYQELLGWVINKDEAQDYHYILNNGRMNGGIRRIDTSFGNMPSAWTTFFSVNNIDTTVKKAAKLGGNMLMPILDVEGNGRLAVIADPTGAVCTFIQLIQPEAWNA